MALAGFGAFRGVPEAALKQLARVTRVREFERGDVIVREGDTGETLFLLSSGRAYAIVPDAHGELFDDHMAPGELFGEMSLLTGEPRSATIKAAELSCCYEIPFDALRAVFTKHPELAAFLTSTVGRRLLSREGIREVGPVLVHGRLGRGGFATVFAGLDRRTGNGVAVKMLRHQLVWRPAFAERFRREAAVVRRIEHPNIARVVEVLDAYATIFIVMELVAGPDLDRWLTMMHSFEPAHAAYVFRTVALALHEAHVQGVIHRDVKPSNILMTPDGEVKLVDFGVAVAPEDFDDCGAVHDGFTGTPHYAAPEHVLGLKMDGRTDLYMLGITLLELVSGTPPFSTDTPLTVLRRHVGGELPDARRLEFIPAPLGELIYRCTRRDPAERFASCADAVAFLDASGIEVQRPAPKDVIEDSGRPAGEHWSEAATAHLATLADATMYEDTLRDTIGPATPADLARWDALLAERDRGDVDGLPASADAEGSGSKGNANTPD